MTIRTCTSIARRYWDNLVCPVVERDESTPKKRLDLWFLSIGIGAGYLQPEMNISRAIDRTYQINL